MKTILLVLLIISNSITAQTWTQISDYPSTAIDDGVSFKIGTAVYCGTGQTPWWSSQGNFYKFNTTSDQWTSISPLPLGEERFYACGFSYDDKGFVFGGYNGSSFLNDLWIYDPASDTWQESDTLPGIGRSGAASFVIDSFAYIIGGTSGSFGRLDEVWRLNLISNEWTALTNLPFGERWRGSAVAINGKGYYLFGRDNANQFYIELYEYDPTIDSWTQIDTFPMDGRSHASMIVCAQELYVLAGVDSTDSCHADLWHYSLSANNWTELTSIPIENGIRGGMCFSSTNSIYYSTGIDQNNDRVRSTWKLAYPLAINELSATLMSMYPNPATNSLNISVEKAQSFSISSADGKAFYAGELENGINTVDLNKWPAGFYFVKIGDHEVQKLIVHK